MEIVKSNLKNEREKKGISYAELSKITKIAKSTLQRYETGTTIKIPLEAITKIADALGVPPARLMGWDDIDNTAKSLTAIKIPVFSKLLYRSQGKAVQEIINYVHITQSSADEGEHFGLQIKGDSMEPRVKENDIVIVRKQSDAKSEDLVLVQISGNDTIIRKLVKQDTGILLIPFNTEYPPTFYTKSEIKSFPVEILGKIVELRARF